MTGVIPNLKSWVRYLALTSKYAKRLWRDLSKGRWEAKNHGLGKDAVMRPPSGEEETLALVPKPVKDNKRKKASTSEALELNTRTARKPKKNTIPLTEELVRRLRDVYEEEKDDDSRLMSRVKMSVEAPKTTESMKAAKILFCDEGVSGREFVEVPESSRIEATSHHNEPMVGTAMGAVLEGPRDGENTPSDSLGAIEIRGFLLLPSFSEEMIREARVLRTPSVEGGHGREDPFHDYFTGVEDVTGLSDLEVSRKESGEASGLFNGVQRALNMASALYREACSRSLAELSRYEANLRRLTEERNALRLRCEKIEEEIKDLQAELTKAHQDQTDLTEQVMKILKLHGLDPGSKANISNSQLQQKLEMIGQLREEVDIIKVETLGWNEGMDHLDAEKEVVRAQLSLAEGQLQGMKERSTVQARKIEELEARLTSKLAKAKSEAEKAKAEVDAFVAIYRADAEAAQVPDWTL
ncbi:cilia- and flagella-associated protein 58-like [Nicotiana tomentosiformis]|uniref:cilia- and flagella-associated protein 58-like n=1 Tax=Nicotiana tomentosiformis TaxID=4098 RepID=UPI00388C9FDE